MKYPKSLVSVVRQKTLDVEVYLEKDFSDAPMKVFDDTFSRYSFILIANKKAVKMNIPLNILEEIKTLTDIVKNKYYSQSQVKAVEKGIAFTKKFTAGKLKGMSPAEVLKQPNGRQVLKEQYEWLKENPSKFPKNKELMGMHQ